MTINKNITAAALSAIELICNAGHDVVLRDSMFELRIMMPSIDADKPDKKRLFFGYFDNAKRAYDALEEFSESHNWCGAYITLHPVNRSNWKHSPNRIMRSSTGLSAADRHIISRAWVVVDIDPNREPKEQPSSEEEKLAAWESIEIIKRYCMVRGMPEPIVADSGNGYHLLWKCEIPVESTVHKRMLIELASKFNSPKITVDCSVSNPARIWKIYGTLTRKGVSTPERPFRYSKIISVPDIIEVINEESIDSWIPSFGNEAVVKIYEVDGTFRILGAPKTEETARKPEPAYKYETQNADGSQKTGVGDEFNPGLLLREKFNPIEKARS